MDENRPPYSLKALGSPNSGSPRHLPGRGSFPDVDDHLVEPEVTRDQIIGGRRVVLPPAEPAHAIQHGRLNYVLRAHVAHGYLAAAHLLTRFDEESDFASDACVFKDGIDPATGGRYLEEIVFEVVSEQDEQYLTEKAVRMHRRGVRRIFTVWVMTGQEAWVGEWAPEGQSWRPLKSDSRIEDSCLVAPLEVIALFEAAAADNAVVEALVAKEEARGRMEGISEAILKVLAARGIAVNDEKKQEILGCRDLDRLDLWLHRAALASSADEITSDL